MNDLSVYNETEEIRPSNPFLHNQRKENSVLDIALQVMATVTARKAPRQLLPFTSICTLIVFMGSSHSHHFDKSATLVRYLYVVHTTGH